MTKLKFGDDVSILEANSASPIPIKAMHLSFGVNPGSVCLDCTYFYIDKYGFHCVIWQQSQPDVAWDGNWTACGKFEA